MEGKGAAEKRIFSCTGGAKKSGGGRRNILTGNVIKENRKQENKKGRCDMVPRSKKENTEGLHGENCLPTLEGDEKDNLWTRIAKRDCDW